MWQCVAPNVTFVATQHVSTMCMSSRMMDRRYWAVALPGYFGIVQAFMPFLLAYGFLFNAIPAVRFFLNKAKNSEIRERNSRRRVFRAVVSQNTRKIDSARQFKRKIDRVDEGGFDSGTDIAKDYRERELKEFDENMKR